MVLPTDTTDRIAKPRSLRAGTLSVLGIVALGSSEAMAANCQDFNIWLQNEARIEIKAVRFEYKDGSSWKTENIFGVDGYERIDLYNTSFFKRSLQGIGDESTQFRVTYKLDEGYTSWGLKKWGADIVETVNTFTCHDNGRFIVRLFVEPVGWQ